MICIDMKRLLASGSVTVTSIEIKNRGRIQCVTVQSNYGLLIQRSWRSAMHELPEAILLGRNRGEAEVTLRPRKVFDRHGNAVGASRRLRRDRGCLLCVVNCCRGGRFLRLAADD